MHILIAIAVALALGGGVSIAAQQAEPGEALYGVKTHVNDNVRATIDIVADSLVGEESAAEAGAEAQANVDADAHIQSQGELDTNINADATTHINAGIR